jgi:hypothetical protein
LKKKPKNIVILITKKQKKKPIENQKIIIETKIVAGRNFSAAQGQGP